MHAAKQWHRGGDKGRCIDVADGQWFATVRPRSSTSSNQQQFGDDNQIEGRLSEVGSYASGGFNAASGCPLGNYTSSIYGMTPMLDRPCSYWKLASPLENLPANAALIRERGPP